MRNFRGNKKRVTLGRYPSRVELRSKSFDWALFEKFWPCKPIVDAALRLGTWRPTNHRKIQQSKRHTQITLSFLPEMAGLQNEKEIRSISICIDMSVREIRKVLHNTVWCGQHLPSNLLKYNNNNFFSRTLAGFGPYLARPIWAYSVNGKVGRGLGFHFL